MNRVLSSLLAIASSTAVALACRTTGPSLVKDEQGNGPDFRTALAAESDLTSLEGVPNSGTPYVLFLDYFGVPSPDPVAGQMHFINTSRFERHLFYMNQKIARYSTLSASAYSSLIFANQGENGANAKEITAGALYYKSGITPPAGFTGDRLLGFDVYHTTVNTNGQVDTIIDIDEVKRMQEKIRAAASFLAPENIAFLLPTSPSNQGLYFKYKTKLDQAGIRFIRSHLFHKVVEQPTTYSAGTSYGYLRKISAADLVGGFYSERDILVLGQVPIDIGPTAGIISAEPQVPHSHIIFRAIPLKLPDLYLPHAFDVPVIRDNIGKLVEFKAAEDGTYSVISVDADPTILEKAEAYWSSRAGTTAIPEADLSIDDLFGWKTAEPTRLLTRAYGAKGVNFAFLDRALSDAGVEARDTFENSFLVPFSFYERHLQTKLTEKVCKKAREKCESEANSAHLAATREACSAGVAAGRSVREYIGGLLTSEIHDAMRGDPVSRRANLCFIQRTVLHTKPQATDLATIKDRMTSAFPATRRIRFRSSTNAEDVQGLNGAGLYESKSACLADGDEDSGGPSACRTPKEIARARKLIEKLQQMDPNDARVKASLAKLQDDLEERYPLSEAITKVFASTWTERAYLTREFYGIDHMKVYMAMLVHPSFIEEAANGVAIVTLREDGGADVNAVAQVDDISVTNPEYPGAQAERFTLSTSAAGQWTEPTYVTHSNLVDGNGKVLSAAEAKELARQLVLASRALVAAHGPEFGTRIDLEFILGPSREVLIKQGRPL